MRRLVPLLLLSIACAAPADLGDYDPFAALEGKADGASFDDASWSLVVEGERLDVVGHVSGSRDLHADYRDIERLNYEGALLRIRLDGDDSLAGMRSFLVVQSNVAALQSELRVAEAMDLATPRAAAATLVLDGVAYDDVALVEHCGDRFLKRHFDDKGSVLREESELDPYRAIATRDDESALRAITETFDASLALALAFEVLRPALTTPLITRLAELEDGRVVAHVEVGSVMSAAALGDESRDALDVPETFAPTLRSYGDFFESAFDDASTCEPCAEAPVDLASAWSERYADAVGPRGDGRYRRHRWQGDTFIATAANHVPGALVVSVEAVFEEGVRHPFEFDAGERHWQLELDAPSDATPYVVHYHCDDGRVLEEARTLSPALDELEELARVPLDVNEPSGLARFGANLMTVGDEGNDVIVIDTDGTTLERIDVSVRGMEGVVFDPLRAQLLVSDEDRGDIIRLDLMGNEIERHHYGWADEAAGGIEGLTLDSRTGHIFMAKEASPSRIAVLDEDGDELVRERVDFAGDVSALAYDASEGVLYALSDRDQSLYRLDANFEVEVRWPLDIDKPEGLVVHEGHIYVVSDTDAEMVHYALTR